MTQTTETHRCGKCGRVFGNAHGLSVHNARSHNPKSKHPKKADDQPEKASKGIRPTEGQSVTRPAGPTMTLMATVDVHPALMRDELVDTKLELIGLLMEADPARAKAHIARCRQLMGGAT